MADTYIQLPTDGTGKKVRAVSQTVGGETVHSQYVILDTTAGNATTTSTAIVTNTVTAVGTVTSTSLVSGTVSSTAYVSNTVTTIGTVTSTSLISGTVTSFSETVDDTGNSTTAVLASGESFIGTAFEMTKYASWSVSIFADKNSASSGLQVQWSCDGTNWDYSDKQTYNASAGNMVTFGHKTKYVRLNFTNGATAQTAFRVCAFAQPNVIRQTRKFVGDQLFDQDTGQVVIAGIQGRATTGTTGGWVDVKVNPSGSLSIAGTITGTVTASAVITNSVTSDYWQCSTASLTSVAGATTTAVILASASNRKGASIFNNSNASLFIAFNATPSTGSFSVKLTSYSYFELPTPVYTGVINGIWDTTNGSAQVTEYT